MPSTTYRIRHSLSRPAILVCLLALGWIGLNAGAAVGSPPPLEWKSIPGGRKARVTPIGGDKVGFTSVLSAHTGINFTNWLPDERGFTNQILYSGSGVATGDMDGDGWCDLYFCSLDGANQLYRNLGGWKFELVTNAAVVRCTNQASTGATFTDVDGDRDLDLLVSSLGHGTRLFQNDGRGHFTEVTMAAGLDDHAGSMSLALADIEGDGDLDIYVANYRTDTLQDQPNTTFRVSTTGPVPRIVSVNGKSALDPEFKDRYFVDPVSHAVLEHGEPDSLFLNDGQGKFTRASWTDGRFVDEAGQLSPVPLDWGLTVMFRDMNGDSAPDIYVCNDADSVDRIWINDGSGKFRALGNFALRKTSFSSMGVDFADINRDGWDDFYVSDMLSYHHVVRHTQMVDRRPPRAAGSFADRPAYMQNTLFFNRGDGTYAEIAQFSGVDASDWSWMPLFLDVDLDGYEDLLITTGLERSFRDADTRRRMDQLRAGRSFTREQLVDLRRTMPPLHNPNFAFRNRGNLTFELVSDRWAFNSRQVSHGMALADLDNDGDQDVVVNCMNTPALLYRNEAAAPRVAVRLRGTAPNTQGIGAKLKVSGGPVSQTQEMIAGGRYLSGDESLRMFAAGPGQKSLRIEITWRNGQQSVVTNVEPNSIVEVDEATAADAVRAIEKPVAPMFRDVSHLLNHRHQENPFDDFERQPLLSRGLSRLGPGAAWYDLDGNGWDDIILSGGRGGELTLFLHDGVSKFSRLDAGELMGRNPVDQAAVLGWAPRPEVGSLLVALSNYEGGGTNVPAVLRYDIGVDGANQVQALPGRDACTGPLALADVDGDGDLDLFVGGRVVPGRYPEATASQIFVQVNERFVLSEKLSEGLRSAGLVSAGLFSDLNADGWPDLVLACEWGPLRVWRNERGKLVEVTVEIGLQNYRGWWNGVAAGDVDGDGRLDLVASNWGRNCRYQGHVEEPLRVYYGDVFNDGTVELIEAYYDATLKRIVPWRFWDTITQALPFVQETTPTFGSYSGASVSELLGDRATQLKSHSVTTLDSMVFLNRGARFEARVLPREAQFAPAFGVTIADWDGDGKEDLFLSQNFFEVDTETGRYDAGRGLCLLGDGAGEFRALAGQHSGVVAYGEQRACATGDFDHDGRADLLVTQNGAETKLFHNETARPGLRVRLKGPVGNPGGIGAVIRLEFRDALGPAREVRAGSGYWSQDSPVAVMGMPTMAIAIRVRWPGGGEVRAVIPKDAREILVDHAGRLGVLPVQTR